MHCDAPSFNARPQPEHCIRASDITPGAPDSKENGYVMNPPHQGIIMGPFLEDFLMRSVQGLILAPFAIAVLCACNQSDPPAKSPAEKAPEAAAPPRPALPVHQGRY